jgi:hypothetical protein
MPNPNHDEQGKFSSGDSSIRKTIKEAIEKPDSPHGEEYEHKGRADLAAQGFKPKGRGAGTSQHDAALVAWKHAQNIGKPATAVIGGRGWTVLRPGDKVPFSTPHMTVSPEGIVHAYNPKPITKKD